MPDISKITLPSGSVYDIKDTTAREMISGGISYDIAWDGNSTPVVADIPAGVVVTYNGTQYTGTLLAEDANAGSFYLVKSSTNPSSETLDIYDEYVPIGATGSKTWEKIGDTQLNLTDVVTDVSLAKQTENFVTGYSSPTTDTFVKSVTAETGKNLDTTTASKATSAASQTTATGGGTASTVNTDWLKGVSVSNETLVIGAATLNTQTTTQQTFADVTVATGTTSAAGTGDPVVTNVSVGSSASAITALGTADTASGLLSTTGVNVTKGN